MGKRPFGEIKAGAAAVRNIASVYGAPALLSELYNTLERIFLKLIFCCEHLIGMMGSSFVVTWNRVLNEGINRHVFFFFGQDVIQKLKSFPLPSSSPTHQTNFSFL